MGWDGLRGLVAAGVLAGAAVACTTDAGVVEGETFASTGTQGDDGASAAASEDDDDDDDGDGGVPGGCGNEGDACSSSAPCCDGLGCVEGQCVGAIECNEAGMICDPGNPYAQCCAGLSCEEGNCLDPNAEDTGTTGDEAGDESGSGSDSTGGSDSGSSGDGSSGDSSSGTGSSGDTGSSGTAG